VRRGFVVGEGRFASTHAATLAATGDGLVAAWFAGTREGAADVAIWLAREARGRWEEPERVAHDRRHPAWNPVLHATASGALLLFYKVGPNPRRWWGMAMRSEDDGRSWSPSWRLPSGFFGPVRSKPLELACGRLLCPSSSEHLGWRAHIEATDDEGRSWRRLANLNPAWRWGAIQPTLLHWPDGRLQALCRTRQRVVTECWSEDEAATFSPMTSTGLVNPDSAVDGLVTAKGLGVLVHNDSARQRTPLSLSVSADGRPWRRALVLEDGPGAYAYPAIIEAGDGRLHIAYSWNRRAIAHIILEEGDLPCAS